MSRDHGVPLGEYKRLTSARDFFKEIAFVRDEQDEASKARGREEYYYAVLTYYVYLIWVRVQNLFVERQHQVPVTKTLQDFLLDLTGDDKEVVTPPAPPRELTEKEKVAMMERSKAAWGAAARATELEE